MLNVSLSEVRFTFSCQQLGVTVVFGRKQCSNQYVTSFINYGDETTDETKGRL
jgi:hypothetical protein